MLQNLTLEAIKTSYLAANAAYCTRKGAGANLNKKGMNPDIYKGMRAWETMSESQFTAVAMMLSGAGVNVLTGIEGATNTKKALRIPQFLSWVVSGDYRELQGSARTALLEIAALRCGAANRESLAFAAVGYVAGDKGTGVAIRDTAPIRKLQLLAGKVKHSTEQTQNSVSFSAGGIAETLGIARKDSRKSHPVLNDESPILRAVLEQVNRTSEQTLFEFAHKGEGDEQSAPVTLTTTE